MTNDCMPLQARPQISHPMTDVPKYLTILLVWYDNKRITDQFSSCHGCEIKVYSCGKVYTNYFFKMRLTTYLINIIIKWYFFKSPKYNISMAEYIVLRQYRREITYTCDHQDMKSIWSHVDSP